jgi:hypothetical protein
VQRASSALVVTPLTGSGAARRSGWPLDLLLDPAKQPRVVGSAAELVNELLFGEHLDEIVVLKGGVELLQQQGAVPAPVLAAAEGSDTVRGFLEGLDERTRQTHNARVYHLEKGGRSTRQLRKDASGREYSNLEEKLAALQQRAAEVEDKSMYVAELRRTTKFRHNSDGHWAKTALSMDVKDYVGVDRAALVPYWDRYDEGVFVGGRFAGSAMHVDQVGWSNVGKNWMGYKLVAIWPYGEVSNKVLDSHLDLMFMPPLSAADGAVLRQAAKIALVEPGDVFLFSGGQAHATLCVGDGLCLGAYESFVNLNPLHAEVFISSNMGEVHFRECHASEIDLRDIKLDIADQLNDAIEQLPQLDPKTQQRLRAAVAVFRSVRETPHIEAPWAWR